MTAEQPLEEGARRRRRIDPHSGKKMMLNDPHSRIVISSDCEKSLLFEAQGLTVSLYVLRTSPLSLFVFHPARTLSGSLRSPPSPRGGRLYDAGGKAVFSLYSLYRWRSGQRFCMTTEQPLEEGARRRRRIDPYNGKK